MLNSVSLACVFLGLWLLCLSPAYAQEKPLEQILKDHELWLKTGGKQGKRANLSKADLHKANLSKVNLSEANLSGTEFLKQI